MNISGDDKKVVKQFAEPIPYQRNMQRKKGAMGLLAELLDG